MATFTTQDRRGRESAKRDRRAKRLAVRRQREQLVVRPLARGEWR